ncbi:hypothetical protein LCGC14_1210420 [marine sediment metagenome]|uniref:Phosphoadenosine phosphosulphate reductase domain-containing protein n=1 Tax=marine sediment metagenome TaxID=412755 RepID=A0A0F9NWI8_9ZZZZ
MKRILSFGGGLQTTAMAVLIKQGRLNIDEAVFADTGCEKPETYWYIENYIKPLIDLTILPSENGGLKAYCEKYRIFPSVVDKWCTRIFKVERLNKYCGDAIQLIGFSSDEIRRSENPKLEGKVFPLIEMGISSADCVRIIQNYGLPVPLKSSCYFCCSQRMTEWNWLKIQHPDLFKDALRLENLLYERKPEYKERTGLLMGKPLWKHAEGIQYEIPMLSEEEYSCWSGHCGH